MMNEWILRRLIEKLVRQGPHEKNIIWLYGLINELAQKEFIEDNIFTTDCFLADCFDKSMATVLGAVMIDKDIDDA